MLATEGSAMHGLVAIIASILLLSGCGSGSGGPQPTPTSHKVTISWDANREAAVNSAGGGYTVAISGQAPINVPYVTGPAAPTTTTTTLMSGSYSVTVTAYSALTPPAGGSGSKSLPSSTYSFSVPY